MPQDYGIAYSSSMPGIAADGAQKQARADQYGALHSRSEPLAWAEDGSYFRACNATLGTGAAMGIQTSFSDTANVLFLMRNGSATKKVIPHYLRLICTAAGASTTSSRLAVVLDNANRYSSGGTDLTTSVVCSNSALGPASVVDVLRYSCTAGAAVAKRQVANLQLKTQAAPCWTVGDEVRISFAIAGDSDPQPLSGAAAVCISKNIGPIVLGGQNHCLLIHMWNPANATTAPSWEFEMAWWER